MNDRVSGNEQPDAAEVLADAVVRALFDPTDSCAHNVKPLLDFIAAREAAARAEERERVAAAIEAQGQVCAKAHGGDCIGWAAYRDAARIARTDGAGS